MNIVGIKPLIAHTLSGLEPTSNEVLEGAVELREFAKSVAPGGFPYLR